MSKAQNVTQAKPKIGGAVSAAPVGTTLPTDAKSALDATFKSLGYVTTDGIVNSSSIDTSDVKAWGGDVVMSTQTGKTDTFKLTLMESMDPEVLKIVHGSANVSGTAETGITVASNSGALEDHAFVIDMILRGEAVKRVVIPNGTVSAIDDVTYKDDTPIGYGITITATPDESGNTHYEYISAKAAGKGGS